MRNNLFVLLLAFCASVFGQDFKPAMPGYAYQFPSDYFSHPAYQTEWWYYTGNVTASDGHRFGFELTFFRQGVSRASNPSPWFVHDLWMAHLALSDITGQHFDHAERLNRSGPGIAGVDQAKDIVWNGNWQAHIHANHHQLRAGTEHFDLQLDLTSAKPPAIQGQGGVSQKAEGAGHASHYFSLTRLLTSGTIQVDGKSYAVTGTSWMDHEFFTESMPANEVGWDWLSIQLNDNRELMLYRLRHKDGSIDPYSSGSYVDAQGKVQFLSAADFTMTPEADTWTSPDTHGTYPLRWHIAIPRLQLQLDITTPLRDQELTSRFGPSYWEGAIDVAGTQSGAALRGVGYLEMTGYSAPYRIDNR